MVTKIWKENKRNERLSAIESPRRYDGRHISGGWLLDEVLTRLFISNLIETILEHLVEMHWFIVAIAHFTKL